MKRETLIGLVRELWLPNRAVLLTCVLLTAFSGGAHGIGEKVISLGGAAAWNGAKYREGVTEIAGVRSHPVLVLSSAFNSAAKSGGSPDSAGPSPDLAISFDESSAAYFRDSTGRYRVFASPALEAVDRRFSRLGTGAALFP